MNDVNVAVVTDDISLTYRALDLEANAIAAKLALLPSAPDQPIGLFTRDKVRHLRWGPLDESEQYPSVHGRTTGRNIEFGELDPDGAVICEFKRRLSRLWRRKICPARAQPRRHVL